MSDVTGAWESAYHAPVLVREVVDALRGAGTVLDGTLGGGGHAAALLAAGVRVDAVDQDPQAVGTHLLGWLTRSALDGSARSSPTLPHSSA